MNEGETMAWAPGCAGRGRKVGCYCEATQGLQALGPGWKPSCATASCASLALPLLFWPPPRAPSCEGPSLRCPLWPRGALDMALS